MEIIQCKNWAVGKTIHEKHIFQLFGTCVLYQIEHPIKIKTEHLSLFQESSNEPTGVFITSVSLSETARKCAEQLKIRIVENKKMERFPSIKCNISKTGEKIYHLPFDQQYDKIRINNKEGAFYCATVAEAEKAGFRRAYRWHGNSQE